MLNNENRYLFKFAWKSILRNSGRSFFIGLSVSIAVVIAIWIVAFFDGMNYQIERAVVQTNIGDIQIQEPSYAKTTDSSSPKEWERYSFLGSRSDINPSPELVLDGNISTPEGAAALTVIGIEPELHARFLPLSKHMREGEFIRKDDQDSVIIGKELAEVFKFHVGDQLVLNYQDHLGELRSELLTITGVYEFNSKTFEKRFIYLNQSTWQKIFLNNDTGKILFNRVPITLPNRDKLPSLKEDAERSGLVFKTWKDMNPEMAVVLEFNDGMIRFFFLIVGLTILMTIITPVRMLWQERYKELKMMAVLGVSSKKFWKIGIFEVLQMIALSGILSSILLILIIGSQTQSGIDFRSLNDGVEIERAGIKLPGIIFPQLATIQFVYTFSFVILVLGISYVWSIHRTIAKLEAEI